MVKELLLRQYGILEMMFHNIGCHYCLICLRIWNLCEATRATSKSVICLKKRVMNGNGFLDILEFGEVCTQIKPIIPICNPSDCKQAKQINPNTKPALNPAQNPNLAKHLSVLVIILFNFISFIHDK